MIALDTDSDNCRADRRQACRNDREPAVILVNPVGRDCERGDQYRARKQRQRESEVTDNSESMIESAEKSGRINLGLEGNLVLSAAARDWRAFQEDPERQRQAT